MTDTNAILARAQAVADDLIGTCQSLHDVATEDEQNDLVFCGALDGHVFECEGCGWWCGMEEAHDGAGGFICDDCLEGMADV